MEKMPFEVVVDPVLTDFAYQPTSDTLTDRSDYEPHSTLTDRNVGLSRGLYGVYTAPSISIEAMEGLKGIMLPDWAATALRSGAWADWLDSSEDIYTCDDGQPL